MKILVLEQTPASLSPLREVLDASGHDVCLATSGGEARLLAGSKKPDIAVVEWQPGTDALAEVARLIRSGDDPTFRSLLAVVDTDTPEARHAAYEAGADDVAMLGASPRELADHVRSAARIVRLERRLRERVVELESALRRLAVQAARGHEVAAASRPRGGLGFLLTNTWTDLENILAKTCGEFVQRQLDLVVNAAPPPVGWPGARVSLADLGNELKLELTFITSPEAAKVIATSLCGDAAADDDVIRDILLELANTGMGAVRAAFLGEEFGFAASIPEPATSGEQTKLLQDVEAKRALTYRANDGATVHVIVALRPQGRVKLPGARLREGMVVASDVTTDTGLLVLRAGTRLTETTALKLAKLFPKREFELAEAA